MINKRLSNLSCNEEGYEKTKSLYETALNESGYKTTLAYTKTTNVNNRNRARNIIWFNPPYSQNVKTNIGKTFLKLVKSIFQEVINYIKYSIKHTKVKLQLHE